MDPKPEHRAHQGQDSGDVERALPAEALGKNRREGGGNRPTQMYTHVHKTGHRASVRADQIDRSSKDGTCGEKQGSTPQGQKQDCEVRIGHSGTNKDRAPTKHQATAADPTAPNFFPKPLTEVV